MGLKKIAYKRHEFRHKPDARKGTLLALVYDIPYFGACGIFPPLHILNQILSSGGQRGGMGPGATWRPFTISQEEYAELVEAVRSTPMSDIRGLARYAFLPFKFDPSFDHLLDRMLWLQGVCEKHRKNWHRELRKAGMLD